MDERSLIESLLHGASAALLRAADSALSRRRNDKARTLDIPAAVLALCGFVLMASPVAAISLRGRVVTSSGGPAGAYVKAIPIGSEAKEFACPQPGLEASSGWKRVDPIGEFDLSAGSNSNVVWVLACNPGGLTTARPVSVMSQMVDVETLPLFPAAEVKGTLTSLGRGERRQATVIAWADVPGATGEFVIGVAELRKKTDFRVAVPLGSAMLRVESPGFQPIQGPVDPYRGRLEVVLRPAPMMTGCAMDGMKRAREGAVVVASDGSSSRTDSSGCFQIDVRGEGRDIGVTIRDGARVGWTRYHSLGPHPPPEIALRIGESIEGSVLAAGRPVSSAIVVVHDPESPHTFWLNSYATTGADGSFAVRGLLDRTYKVEVSRSGYVPVTLPHTRPSRMQKGGFAACLERAGPVDGLVEFEDGSPVGGALVAAHQQLDPRAFNSPVNLTGLLVSPLSITRSDGSFRFDRLSSRSDVSLEARTPGVAWSGVAHTVIGQTGPVFLRLNRGGTARGRSPMVLVSACRKCRCEFLWSWTSPRRTEGWE